MGTPVQLRVQGVATARPTLTGFAPPSSFDTLAIALEATYDGSKVGSPTVDAPDGSPFVVPFEGITKGRFFAIRVQGGALKVKITSPNGGVDQVIPVSDELVLHNPEDGDELTAIKLVGSAIETRYLLAGDTD